jgi:hypothetical protein
VSVGLRVLTTDGTCWKLCKKVLRGRVEKRRGVFRQSVDGSRSLRSPEKALFVCEIAVGRGWYYRNTSVVRSRGLYLKWKDRLENRAYV